MNTRKVFRELVKDPELLILPGAYDALSAKIIAAHGFKAIVAGGYAAIGSLLGQGDMGQSNMRDYADHFARICDAVDIPVYVDLDTGFGGVHNVRQAVRAFENAGVAGLFINDQSFPNRCGYLSGKEVVPLEDMLAKVAAALDARRDADMFICARTDVAAVEGIDSAIERCNAFMKAGVDMAKPQGLDTPSEIERAIREVPGPHFATLSQAASNNTTTLSQLKALGVSGVTLPSLALFAAAQGVERVMSSLSRESSLLPLSQDLMKLETYYARVGLERLNEREVAYKELAQKICASS